mmetsp:Transcript_7408/g.14096  ORF Transcript_7408/g.14096 Transcript_7408/m.14096 type:complete len:311 (+) Transcript_7408:59-991(+)
MKSRSLSRHTNVNASHKTAHPNNNNSNNQRVVITHTTLPVQYTVQRPFAMKVPFFHKLISTSTNLLTSKATATAAPHALLTRSSSSTNSVSTSCTSATDLYVEHDDDLDDFLSDNDEDDDNVDHHRRKVRFAMAQTELYENHDMTAEQVRSLWYTKTDFQVFKQAVWDRVHDIVHSNDTETSETTKTSTVRALGEAYLGFCRVQSAADIFTVMETCHQIPHLQDVIGLDRLLVKQVMVDRMVRKRRLQRQILSWQDHHLIHNKSSHHHHNPNDPESRADFLRQLSRLESQPSRLYAHHIAQCAWRSGEVP